MKIAILTVLTHLVAIMHDPMTPHYQFLPWKFYNDRCNSHFG